MEPAAPRAGAAREGGAMREPYPKELPMNKRLMVWPTEAVLGAGAGDAAEVHARRATTSAGLPESDVSRFFAKTQEQALAQYVKGEPRRMPPVLNRDALFTQAAPFGDTNDLYYHSPSNRIGSNYSPSSFFAGAALFEHVPGGTAPGARAGGKKLAPLERLARKAAMRNSAEGPPPPPNPVHPEPLLDSTKDRGSLKDFRAPFAEPTQPARYFHETEDLRRNAPDGTLYGLPIDNTRYVPDEVSSIADAVVRYHFYVERGIDDQFVAPFNLEWWERARQLVPAEPPRNVSPEYFDALVEESYVEMVDDYVRSVKRAILDYTLCSYKERARLDMEPIIPVLRVPPSQRSPLGEYLPDVWRQGVEDAREDIAWSLQTLSLNALELSALWENFAPKLLLDADSDEFAAKLPFECEPFRAFQTECTERVKSALWSAWVPKSSELFRRIPPVFINADAEAYYRSIATLQSNQLRTLVTDSFATYLRLFELHSPAPQECDPQGDVLKWSTPPCFRIYLNAQGAKQVFEPSFREIADMVEETIDQCVQSVEGVPRVGAGVVSNSAGGGGAAGPAPPSGAGAGASGSAGAGAGAARKLAHIPVTGLEESSVAVVKSRVEAILEENTVAPTKLAALFDNHMYILDIDTPAYVDKFGHEQHTLEEYAEEIDKFYKAVDDVYYMCASNVRTGLYVVDCTGLQTALMDKANEVAGKLLDQIRKTAMESNNSIVERYTIMHAEVGRVANTTEEILALKKYIQKCAVELEQLQNEINMNKRREAFLFDYRFECPEVDFLLAIKSYEWPKKIVSIMKDAIQKANQEYRAFEDAVKARRTAFAQLLVEYEEEISEFETRGELDSRDAYAKQLKDMKEKLAAAQIEGDDINYQEQLFGWPKTAWTKVAEMSTAVEPYYNLWSIASEFYKSWAVWMNGPFSRLDPEEVEERVGDMFRTMFKLNKYFSGLTGQPERPEPLKVAEACKEKIEKFQELQPIINSVCNPGLRDRHWLAMSEIVGFDIKRDDHTSLSRLLDRHIEDHKQPLEELSDHASREATLEKNLDKMEVDWQGVSFEAKPWKETGTYIMGGGPIDEAQVLLDDHIVKAQAMAASPFAKPFEHRLTPWLAKLVRLQDIIDAWLKCQSSWIYLEPIFGAEEIMRQIPVEGQAFRDMDAIWRRLMTETIAEPLAMDTAIRHNLLEDLQECNRSLGIVEKGLNDFCESKKMAFPRFYFLSNDELLEILSEAKDPIKVQPFIRKCFESIKDVEFTPEVTIVAMTSFENEKVPFVRAVNPAEMGGVENWMLEIQNVMQQSLLKVTGDSIAAYAGNSREKWILEWPGQLVLCVGQLYWTKEVTAALDERGNDGLREYGEKCSGQLTNIVNLVRGELTKLERATLGALVVIDVHARDVVVQMAKDGVSATTDFAWLAQLRYTWEHDDSRFNTETIYCRMINAEALYGYEYLGNSSRLVITPLTDRCYRTLMGAIHLYLGGAPAGPAGTGKTETTKDLSKALAIQCVVFNCSDSMDYIMLGKFFKGLACAGAWACFDEFNRIELEVLSVVAQQVLTIQRAVARRATTFIFEGVELKLVWTCNVFITMNPGYAGRSELPDNLKALFRDVAMMVPDYAMIGEIILYSFGYLDARSMARKLVQTYRLCSEQLSSQDHYDYGMRAVISVLRAAGNLKRQFTEEQEDVLMLRSIQDVNLPKFLDQDVPLFKGILSDLFPGVTLPVPDYDNITEALRENCVKRDIEPLDTFFTKAIQLYEMIVVRHGLMLVGESFAMKTESYRVLAMALGDLNAKGLNSEEKTKTYVLNPKSVSMAQLYGSEDPVSKEWQDGVLAVLFRNAARDTSPDRKWVIFDGPVDAIWIENMNTVLDDNKKLCLNSGEIVAMQGLMNMIFEVQDLAVASPATVSRCGMVYMQASLLGWKPVLDCWMRTLPDTLKAEQKDLIRALFMWLVPPCLRVATKMAKSMIPLQEINLARACMRLFTCLGDDFADEKVLEGMNDNLINVHIQSTLLFSIVWSIGGTLDDDGRAVFNTMLRKLLVDDPPKDLKPFVKSPPQKITQLFPEGKSVYDFVFNKDTAKWSTWLDMADDFKIDPEAEYTSIVVQTVDTVRYTFLVDKLVTHGVQTLFAGPTGTGKTIYVKRHLSEGLDQTKYRYLFFNFSAQTSANATQDIIDGGLDKRRKGVYGPPIGQTMVVFVDDLSMPQIETYGAQPPIELLRQWMDHGGWYDRKENTFRQLVDIQFVAAMPPPGGGRNSVTNRYLRHFSVLSATEFDDAALTKIFVTLVDWWILKYGYDEKIAKVKPALVSATIDLYKTARRELLPTPAKSHYTFNLRDLSKVFQGLTSTGGSVDDSGELMRLWVHESMRVFHDRLTDDTDRNWFVVKVEEIVEQHFKQGFHKVMARLDADKNSKISMQELRGLVFGDFMVPGADNPPYDEILDTDRMLEVINEYLSDMNATSKSPMQLVIFGYAMEHISRICRIIKQPSGHALLVGLGGSGRKCLTRLAAFVEEYELFSIEITKTYGQTEWRDDLKKIIKMAGELNKRVVFLISDAQIGWEGMVEDVSNILNTAEVPNLLDAGDLAGIYENIRPRAKAAGMDKDKTAMYNFFLQTVKRNLHIVFAMSPVGDAFRDRLRKFPALVNCTTIDWFSAWPTDGLETVASFFFKELPFDEATRGVLVRVAVKMHETVQELAAKYLANERRHYYVTPTSYLELIGLYQSMLNRRQSEVNGARKRYLTGLEKLSTTEESVAGMQEELVALQPELVKAGEETDAAMVVIAKETEEADKVKEVVSKEEAVASAEAAKVKAFKDECEAMLAEAMPLLEAALKALDTLTKNDIVEVKGMKSPPAGVKLVMEAVCILKGLKAARVKDKDSGKMVDDFWVTSVGMIQDPKFLESLREFDKDHIDPKIIQKIKPYVENPAFDPALIKKASNAAYGLCCWVRAMEAYDRVAKVVEPKRIALAEAEVQLAGVMEALGVKQAELQKVVDKLNALDEDLTSKKNKKAQLEADVELCTVKLDRAQKLISGLGGEKSRWTAAAESLGEEYERLTGDILLAAGVVAYLGPFTMAYRQEVVPQWVEMCKELSLPCSDKFTLVNVLGDPVKIRAWQISGLPRDEFSSENGVVVDQGRRWPLMIDPQGLANKWVRNLEKDSDLGIIKLTDKDYLRTLEISIQYGKPVLLENVGETLDAALEPLLQKQIFKQSGAMCIKLGDSVVEYNNAFKFYITTKLRNPHYSPEICTKVSMLNFTTVLEGLNDQVLGIVVAKERPDLEEAKNKLIVQGAENKRKLKEIEDRILHVLSASEGNILEDEGAVATLSESKVVSDQIAEEQKVADETEAKIDSARVGYAPVAMHASLLYFAVADMANIDPMYKYSLDWFVNLFVRAIKDSPKSQNLSQRLTNLADFFTFFLFQNVVRSLFEKDKLLFAFLLGTKLQLASKKMDADELRFFLTGGISTGSNPHPNPAEEWLSEKGWGEICRLSDLPKFQGLREHVEAETELWKAIYDSTEPHNATLPGQWADKLNGFQFLLVLRTVRPDKVIPALTHYVGEAMGKRFVEPIPFDLAPSFGESSATQPLLFVLSAGSDPMATLLKFADDKKMRVEQVSLGQGQGPIAANWIDQGIQDGFWVVLQNCHLAKSFMTPLEVICETKLVEGKVHQDFRLWLTSYPTDLMPVSILENSVKMTNEPPRGLRAGILRTLRSDPISDPEWFDTCTKDAWFRKLLFGLAFFHSIVQERRKFGPIGWNVPYEFNENDLRISLRQLKMFLDENEEVPFDTIRYTCGECNYGGKVTDAHDRVTLMCILRTYYCEETLDDAYRFSTSGLYYAPPHGDHASYVAFINALPLIASPEAFGMHENADISKENQETSLVLDNFLLTQSRSGGGGGKSQEEVIGELAEAILARIPPNFDLEAVGNKYPQDYYDSMNTVLVQELERANRLISVVRSTLVDLGKAVKGLVLLSAELDAIGQAMFIGKVPAAWLKKSFPSLKPLGSYINELLDRIHFFQGWIDDGAPTIFWLSSFWFTQAFLTGAKQNFARRYTIPIDGVDFDYMVMDDEAKTQSKPQDGVYCNGMFIEGARWDYDEHVIGESQPKVLYTTFPVVWFEPAETTKFREFDHYECPMYKTLERRGILSTTGHSTNFVCDLRIPSDKHPDWWTKRGVALFTSLSD